MQKYNELLLDHSRSIDVISMGRVAVDFYAEQIYSPLSQAQTMRKYLGGCAGNIAVGTARLGLKSMIFSCAGKDEMGIFLQETLKKEGVQTDLFYETDKHLTGLVLLGVNPPHHFPLMFYRKDCADMQLKPEHAKEEIIKNAKALLITGTGLSTSSMQETTHHAVQLAKQNHTFIIIDLDFRPVLWGLTAAGDGEIRYKESQIVSAEYQKILPLCDLIVGTEEEICIAGGEKNIKNALLHIRQLTQAPIVVKEGEKGSHIYFANCTKAYQSRPFPVTVLNVLGAGDAFMSGLLRGLLRGESWETAMTYANACGAIVVTRHGCAPAIPNFDELQYFIHHYDNDADICKSQKINQIHRQTTFGKMKKNPFCFLVLEQDTLHDQDDHLQNHSMLQFKQAVYQGLMKIKQTHSTHQQLGVIVNTQHNDELIKHAMQENFIIYVPIELNENESLYQQILKRPTYWGVKFQWQYHVDMSSELKKNQMRLLRKIASICDFLERRLMLEMIYPSHYPDDVISMIDAIKDVYESEIYPFCWKLQTVNGKDGWQQLDAVLDKYDSTATIILRDDVHSFAECFALLSPRKQSRYINGFTFGGKTLRSTWHQFSNSILNAADVTDYVADQFKYFLEQWQEV